MKSSVKNSVTQQKTRKIAILIMSVIVFSFFWYFLYNSLEIGDLFQAQVFNSTIGTSGGKDDAAAAIAGSGILREESTTAVILRWVNFGFSLLWLFAFAALIYAGYLYVANFGDEELTGKAKKIIFFVIIGIVITIGAFALVNTIIWAGRTEVGSQLNQDTVPEVTPYTQPTLPQTPPSVIDV